MEISHILEETIKEVVKVVFKKFQMLGNEIEKLSLEFLKEQTKKTKMFVKGNIQSER